MTPLVSIIINNYNYGRYLPDAIDSALSQNYKNVEVIVVDDGSTDNSREVILQYSEKIIATIHSQNTGQASAFNTGFQNSSGEIIIFLDSDDTLLENCLTNAVTSFDTPLVVKTHWPLWLVDINGKNSGKYVPEGTLPSGNLLVEVIEFGPEHWGSAKTVCISTCIWKNKIE